MERREGSTHRRARQAVVETKRYPSFSSSLLDAIYRSIDEGGGDASVDCRQPSRARNGAAAGENTDFPSARRCFAATAIETKKLGADCTTGAVSGKVPLRRRDYGGTAEHDRRAQACWRELQQRRERNVINSTSSSSESSYGGFSSEAESVRMKPAKSAGWSSQATETRKPRQESTNSIKSRFRASKIYGELKKAKAPVSPGGRLASFINHLFASPGGHLKKVKASSPAVTTTGGDDSTCSSASSYSRSCLSKTPSASRPHGGAKRSVRFYPVSVVVDDDLRPCGQKCVYDDHLCDRFDLSSLPPLPPVRVKNPTPTRQGMEKMALGVGGEGNEGEADDEDDDAASYSSSDLFELENLTAVGGDELPVYETTHLHTNRAIARGLIV